MDEDTIRALVAGSDRKQAALAASTPEQAAMRARAYEEQGKEYLRLSAEKRAQGHGDCTEEMHTATRIAAGRVWTAPWRTLRAVVPRRSNGSSGRPRVTRASRSASSGGDGGDDPPDDEPPPPWVDGRCALLRRLIKRGLRVDAVESAAELICALDEYAAADRRAVA
jgi:hypothetical protein